MTMSPDLASGTSWSLSSNASEDGSLDGDNDASNIDSEAALVKPQDAVCRTKVKHGFIRIQAAMTEGPEDADLQDSQTLIIPFSAAGCRSLLAVGLIDPTTGQVNQVLQSSGQLAIDFGNEPVTGHTYHRDILLVNRSEIDLVWNTAIVNARHKDAVWFSLRDLDAENVFGVDRSAHPIPVPPLSSRRLRLELRVKAAILDFDFDFVISNSNQAGNIVTCRARGSGQAGGQDQALRILTGLYIDFGQIHDRQWVRKLIAIKNTSLEAFDVKLSSTPGYDVAFRLAGVSADDADEELPLRPTRSHLSSDSLSRTSSRDGIRSRATSSVRASREPSPTRHSEHRLSHHGQHSMLTELLRQHGTEADPRALPAQNGGFNPHDRQVYRPPSRTLSRVVSRTSSYYLPASSEDSDEDREESLLPDSASSKRTDPRSYPDPVLPTLDSGVADRLQEIKVPPDTERRFFVLFRSSAPSDPLAASANFRRTSFKVSLDCVLPSGTTARHTISCTALACSVKISVEPKWIDFGATTIGSVKSATITLMNLSALTAKIEIAAISKVLSTNRNTIVIPPFEKLEEKFDFFPRRVNDHYEKQILVRNLLNRADDHLIEVRSKNVDTYNLTLHSHLYRILTPNGANFLDFGNVVINSPTIRSIHFENLSSADLVLELSASQPEDVEIYVKAEDASDPNIAATQGRYASESTASSSAGEMKERFMETMRELSEMSGKSSGEGTKDAKASSKPPKETNSNNVDAKEEDDHIGASVANALKKGRRGKAVTVRFLRIFAASRLL